MFLKAFFFYKAFSLNLKYLKFFLNSLSCV